MSKAFQSPLRLCGFCDTWHSKPCGEGCQWSLNDPIFQDQPNNYMQLMQKSDIMRTALLDIKQAHVPDQPMSSAGNELSWVMSHVGMIRNIATVALDKIK